MYVFVYKTKSMRMGRVQLGRWMIDEIMIHKSYLLAWSLRCADSAAGGELS